MNAQLVWRLLPWPTSGIADFERSCHKAEAMKVCVASVPLGAWSIRDHLMVATPMRLRKPLPAFYRSHSLPPSHSPPHTVPECMMDCSGRLHLARSVQGIVRQCKNLGLFVSGQLPKQERGRYIDMYTYLCVYTHTHMF